MTILVVAVLVALNIGLIFLLLAAPIGVRTIRISRLIQAKRERVWGALWPLGDNAAWSGEYLNAEQMPDDSSLVRLQLRWEGRDGNPIERIIRLEEVVRGKRFAASVVDDSSLDPAFWTNYREIADLAVTKDGTLVTLTRTDRYRGLAFLAFRYFSLRREIGKLKIWAETGKFRAGGWFEHPASQLGFAILSAFLLWPLFGLSMGGLVLAFVLTIVVALHELGHMAAFRLMGHRKVRMIFVPLLGGVAIGGRPYDSRFEVAFVALMGAGFSAFLVPAAIAFSVYASAEGWRVWAALFASLAGCAAFFNIANLVPVWKFDGGQVLRQICPSPPLLALASFFLLGAFLALGISAGLHTWFVVSIGVIFAILSLVTAGGAVKPRHELKPISMIDRLAIGAALLAVFAIHGYGLLWAVSKIA